MISGKPDTQRCVRPVWEGGEARPFRRISGTLPHDTTIFLGGKEKTTLKELTEMLGRETIDLYNTSDTRGSSRSYGMNYQKTGKALMSQDEIAVMDGEKCILQLRGVRPFFSNKFDITKHKQYKKLSDYDKRNAFDIEKYINRKLVIKKDELIDCYDLGELSE